MRLHWNVNRCGRQRQRSAINPKHRLASRFGLSALRLRCSASQRTLTLVQSALFSFLRLLLTELLTLIPAVIGRGGGVTPSTSRQIIAGPQRKYKQQFTATACRGSCRSRAGRTCKVLRIEPLHCCAAVFAAAHIETVLYSDGVECFNLKKPN